MKSEGTRAPQPWLGGRVLNDAVWAVGGSLASALFSVTIAKVVAKLCDVSEYGKASLILGLVALAQGVLLGPLSLSHLRLLYSFRERGLEAEFEHVFGRLRLLASLCCGGLYLFAAAVFASRGKVYYLAAAPLALSLLFAQPYLSHLLNREEVQRQQKRLSLAAAGGQLVQLLALLALLSIAEAKWHVEAVMLAQVLAAASAVAWLTMSDKRMSPAASAKAPVGLGKEVLRSVVAYGWSFPLAWSASWAISTSDRFFLERLLSPAAVGAYVVNYGLWSKPFLLLNGMLEALTRPRIFRANIRGDAAESGRVVALRIAVSTLGAICLLGVVWVAHEPVSELLFPPSFRIPRTTVMWIAVAYSFYALGHVFTPVLLSRDRAHWSLAATLVAAAVNLLCNIYFIRASGVAGAAMAAAFGYITFAACMAAGATVARRQNIAFKAQ